MICYNKPASSCRSLTWFPRNSSSCRSSLAFGISRSNEAFHCSETRVARLILMVGFLPRALAPRSLGSCGTGRDSCPDGAAEREKALMRQGSSKKNKPNKNKTGECICALYLCISIFQRGQCSLRNQMNERSVTRIEYWSSFLVAPCEVKCKKNTAV